MRQSRRENKRALMWYASSPHSASQGQVGEVPRTQDEKTASDNKTKTSST
jgi:hypothetical protein